MAGPQKPHGWYLKTYPSLRRFGGKPGWVWICLGCGMSLVSPKPREYPTLQKLLQLGVHLDCNVELVKKIMES